MATHPYSLRSRLNGQPPSLRTPTGSPLIKTGARSPRKPGGSGVSLQLQQVIGTTTNSPTGLACCPLTNAYAYCAGAIAVLATIHRDGTTTRRYFKARPTATSLNPSSSYYDASSPSVTPSKRRTSIFARRKTQDIDFGSAQYEGISQTWTARERIKTVTCVALSDNGKWLAVGESGYSPRVLLYSTTEDALPVSIVSDHTFGLKCVAFSPDSQYLATLGNLNDGFLFIWTINSKTGALTLHSANKCTTNICSMTWCGQSLVTAGTRHVKVWSVGQVAKPTTSRRFSLRPTGEALPSPGPATLSGRNALLGSLVDCTFTSSASIDNRTVLLGTDTGHLCGIEVSDGSPEVKVLKIFEFGITSISWQSSFHKVVLGSSDGIFHEDYSRLAATLRTNVIVDTTRPRSPRKEIRSSSIRQSLGLLQSKSAAISALGCLAEHTIALDSDGNLHVNKSAGNDSDPTLSFACHNDLIQGVQRLPDDCDLGAFYTWSRRGEVRFWDTGGNLLNSKLVAVDQQDPDDDTNQNELRVVRYMPSTRQFVSGDRFGILRLVESMDWSFSWTGRAHGAELSDISVHADCSLIATCGRDRMVQLFKASGNDLDLIQTMDDHIGAVTQVLFTPDADKLLSCSADRTIVVRERASRQIEGKELIAFLSIRVVTLRSTPLSMALFGPASTTLLASTADRHIVKVNVSSGAVVESVKVSDPENDDTVSLNSLCMSARGTGPEETCNLLAGISSTDKAIRVYDADKCQLLTRESGHTEGVSDLCLIEREVAGTDRKQRVLVSTGLDGTIMIWEIALSPPTLFTSVQEMTQYQAMQGYEPEGTPVKPSPASLPPLRKVLSKMDVIEFTKSPGAASPSSPRSLSPPRLARKRSNLALSATIDEKEEDGESNGGSFFKRDQIPVSLPSERSPSPPPAAFGKIKKQRSRADISSDAKAGLARRSPSPPPFTVSTPSTPKNRTVANNSRLRRPPSVPTDLRGQALTQSRRQSMSQASEFGSMGMATEQACRMLRTYRKKLMASKEDLSLDELEDELELITRLVKDRQEKSLAVQMSSGRRQKAKAATESDVDELAALLDRANMADRSPRQGVEVKS